MKNLFIALIAFPLLFLGPRASAAMTAAHHPAKVSLITEVDSVVPGDTLSVGLHFKLDPHWHVYWRNPGDSGTRPAITWNLPEGFTAGELQWPAPKRLPISHLVNFGYEESVILPTQIKTPRTLKAGTEITLKGKAVWLVCLESCIPGKADLELRLKVGEKPGAWNKWHANFEQTRSRMPVSPTAQTIKSRETTNGLEIEITNAGNGEYFFFPWNDQEIANNGIQKNERPGAGIVRISVPWDTDRKANSKTEGVLVSSIEGEKAIWIDVPLASNGKPNTESANMSQLFAVTFWRMLLLAFSGGLFLNLMPCVFPVLSIKILNFVQQAGHHKKALRLHGWMFGLGVLVSFWILAGALIALRLGGEKLGWGFQFQNPYVLFAMCGLFVFLALNLFGLFEVGTEFMGVGSKLSGKEGLSGSFFSGVLATIVATPCTAPFMGTAIGFAVAQPPIIALLVFTSLGAGMAFPYVMLSFSPGLLKYLPKPGAWMETMKHLMGFPMLGTVVWLVWVFGQQTGMDGILRLLFGLLFLGLAAWLYGRKFRSLRGRRIRAVFAVAALVAGIYLGINGARVGRSTPLDVTWQAFTPELVKKLNAEGKPIFVDFTAAWCVSCQVNEKIVFSSNDVLKTFKEKGIATLKADWTNGDSVITDTLAIYGRSGVPFYLYYPGKPGAFPKILPEVLTPGIVLDALKES